MTSVFDFDDAINSIYNAKTAGKNLVTAKHEVLTKAGDFLFLAHSDKEFALRCQMMEADIESAAKRKMASVSDSKFKLVRALHEEWKIRHANCETCNLKVADKHNFGDKTGSCASCKGTTGHKNDKGWHCPDGAGCKSGRGASKTAAGEWSAMGRATGEGMVCNGGGGPLAVHSCGAVSPRGGLGHNTGLCLNCESKLGIKTPGHDYQGNTFNDHEASKTAEKMCVECKKRPATKKAHGYLDVCDKCDKAQGTTGAKSPLQEKIAGLKTRLAAPFELDKANQNRSVYSVTSQLGPKVAQQLAAKYADRTADRPEMEDEAKAGRWAMITKHDASGNVIDATLGRIGGSEIGGSAETSPLVCTGNTHHGNAGCTHSADDAFGGRHIALQETPAMLHESGTLYPRLTDRKEASIYAPSHRVHILPQEDHDKIESVMNEIASNGVESLGIPAFKREEEGRGKPIETFERGRESSQGQPGFNTEMGASHGVGKVSNFTIWPSTVDFGHFENQLATNRGKGEGTPEMLESGPRDLTGAWGKNKSYGKLLEGHEGKAGSGRVLPVATMLPAYSPTDAGNGMEGALADGTSAGRGITPRLRPVAWGNASDAPTFKFLEGTGKLKAVGEDLRKKLTNFNADRLARVGAERVERAQTTPSTRTPKKQLSMDVLNKLIGQE